MNQHARSAGFTLLELLVVVLIVGMLTSIVGPRLMGQIGRSEVTTARAQMDVFDKALEAYRLDVGAYPSNELGLQALVSAPTGLDGRWRGPYLKGGVPLDPWGEAYRYKTPGSNGRDFELVSLGKDRAVGGTGDASDLTH